VYRGTLKDINLLVLIDGDEEDERISFLNLYQGSKGTLHGIYTVYEEEEDEEDNFAVLLKTNRQ
jgi:hypothetical protein